MKLTSQVSRSAGSPISSALEFAGIDAFVQADARISAQRPGELTGADIDGMHARGTGLQEGVGEAAGGRADIDADLAGDVDGEMLQGAGEFEAAAAHVGRPREHFDARHRHRRTGRAWMLSGR